MEDGQKIYDLSILNPPSSVLLCRKADRLHHPPLYQLLQKNRQPVFRVRADDLLCHCQHLRPAFPMATPRPALFSIGTSFTSSPIAMICSG